MKLSLTDQSITIAGTKDVDRGRAVPKGPKEKDGIQLSSLQKNLAIEEVKNKTIKEQR